jgi:GNAT superfamily N-acetyltransferase
MEIKVESPYSPEAVDLFERLWAELGEMYGDKGPCRFRPEHVDHPGGVFVIAWRNGEAIGCGAIRPLEHGVAELKRMYVRPEVRRMGVAREILATLERKAAELEYTSIRLETGDVQPEAVALYMSEGYASIECYGEHKADPRSRCFEKRVR